MALLEIWPGSRLVLENLIGGDLVLKFPSNQYVLYLLLALSLLSLMLYGRIAEALSSSFKILQGGVNLKDVLNSKQKNDSVRIGFLLAIPFYAFVFFKTKVSPLDYWWILGIIAVYYGYKYLLFKILGWATNKKETFVEVEKHNNGAFFLLMVFSLPALLPLLFSANVPSNTLAIYMLAVAVFLLFIYFYQINKIFIASNFSAFFRFLYLCALEILPILVVVKVVVLTNAS